VPPCNGVKLRKIALETISLPGYMVSKTQRFIVLRVPRVSAYGWEDVHGYAEDKDIFAA
jgi:hypothetical protein